MKRVFRLLLLASVLVLPSMAIAEFDPAPYREITQAELVKNLDGNAGKKFRITDVFNFCGSDFCAQILKTNSRIDPIRVGDYVYSAAWSPNEPMRFALIGKIDPDSIEHYLAGGGYESLRRAHDMTPEQVIAEVAQKGLDAGETQGFGPGSLPPLRKALKSATTTA